MAYINIEAGGYSTRVILGAHDTTVPSKILQEGSTGIVLEGSFTNPKDFYDKILGKDTVAVQYHQVVDHAQRQRSSLIAAEPTWKMEYYQAFRDMSFKDKLFLVVFGFLSKAASDELIAFEGEVSSDDPRLSKVRKWANLTSITVPYMRTNGPFKNHIMAQRLVAFSDSQKARGIRDPHLDLIVGANHVGVIDSLRMTTEERVRVIQENQHGRQYVTPQNLATGHFLVYDTKRNRWNPKTFQDSHLKFSQR